MFTREKIGMMLAELMGTFVLATVFIASASYFNFTAPWYVSIAAGITYATLVAMLSKVSGAHFNPAITIGVWSLRRITATTAVVYITMQLFGGILSLAFVEYITGADILRQGLSSINGQIFTSEMVGAAVFGMGIAAVIMQKLEGLYAACTAGASLTLGVLIASIAASGYINPAVALATNTWDMTVVLAPILGVLLGMNIYSLFFAPEKSLIFLDRKIKLPTRHKK
jgi:glycerol uptake facilitator-like aquaporin